MSLLRVFAFKATHLPNVDKKGCSDPYTTLAYQGKNISNDNSEGFPKRSTASDRFSISGFFP